MCVTVSVVIAAFEAERFIAGAVRSALAQSLHDIEVIVVDDGSRDATVSAAQAAAAADERFRLIRLPRNAGVGAARNSALRAATGRWIAVLDADDEFEPQRLERLLDAAERTGADLVADNVTLLEAGREPRSAFALPPKLLERPIGVLDFISLDTPGLETLPAGFMKPIMRAEFLRRFDLHYPESITCGEDFELYVRSLLRGARLRFIEGAFYHALVRADSVSRSDPERNDASLLRSLQALIDDARRLGNRRAARLLARRANDIDAYVTYSRLSDALHRRRLATAVTLVPRLMMRSYMWRRFGMAVRRRLAQGAS